MDKEKRTMLVDGRAVEIKSCPAEIKVVEEDGDKGIVEGYASVFGNTDSFGDIVDPGAFKKTIKEFFSRIKVLWQHFSPMGVPIEIKEDKHGLFTKSKISLTQENKDRIMLMRDGVIAEMSIGFDTIQSKQDPDDEHIRHLTELKLWEYSFVTWGANDQAEVLSVKSDEEIESMLFKLNDFAQKQGKVLSGKNKKLVNSAIEALQALLAASDPDDKSNQSKNKPPTDEPTDIKSLVTEILDPLNSIQHEAFKRNLLGDLKEFGKNLRRG